MSASRPPTEPYDMTCQACGFSWEEEGPVGLPPAVAPLAVPSCHWCDPSRGGKSPKPEEAVRK